ncbi:ATP-binding protein [Candidatus Micrarchaeota archaeon]|nr:ATP-binding protein [Candidatus Micrarchaeota archaeon]
MVRFSFGAPVSDENFFNREEEIKYIEKRLFAIKQGSRNDLAIVGPRRVGKSSLVLQMQHHARRKGFKTIFIDCEGLSLEDFTTEYGNAIMKAELEGRVDKEVLSRIRGGAGGAIAALSELLGRVRAMELSPVLGEFLKLRIEFENARDSFGGKKESARKLLESSLALTSASKHMYVVIFDEFQETSSYGPGNAFHAIFRRATQYQKNTVYVYTGSSIGMMEGIFGNNSNPLAANADIMEVAPFSEETSKTFMQEGLEGYGKKITEDALDTVWESTGGFPAYLNWAGLRFLDYREGKIGKAEAEKMAEEMGSPVSPAYQLVGKQLSRIGGFSMKVLRSIAEGGKVPAEIGRRSGASNVYVYLERLRKYGMISKKGGEYSISDPLIRRVVCE